MNVRQAGGGQLEVLETHPGQTINNHVHHLVSSAEMMVERDGHAIPETTAPDGFFQGN
jgi:hypothetical protein